MRAAVLFLLFALWLVPIAFALEPEEILTEQADSFGLDDLERAGEVYTGPVDLTDGFQVSEILGHILQQGKQAIRELVRESVASCLLILVVALFCGLTECLPPEVGQEGLRVPTLAAVLAITSIAVGDVHSLLATGEEAICRMEGLGDMLLPAVSLTTAASGMPATAAVKHGITILFSDVLLRLIESLLIPLVYAYVAVHVAWAALGNEGLRRVGGFIRWFITILLTIVLLAFIAYLNLSGVISGSADAATVKAAKFTISNLVPVVGSVIADTAETLLTGAMVLRNAVGVFGMLAVLGICIVPFLNMGVHYLLYRFTGALTATVSGNGRVTGLVDAIGSAFGLIMALTGSAGVLLAVAMISAVSSVNW